MSLHTPHISAAPEDFTIEAPPTEPSVSVYAAAAPKELAPSILIEKLSKDELPGGDNWHQTRERWLDALHQDSEASVYLHPDLIFSNFRDKAPPIVLVRRSKNGEIASLAVLRADNRRIRLIPRLPICVTLKRRKLAASSTIGVRDPEEAHAFAAAMLQVLTTGQSDELHIDDLSVDSPLWNALTSTTESKTYLTHPCPPQIHRSIHFPGTPDAYWKLLNSHDRKNLKSKAKKLTHEIKAYRKPEEVAEFLSKAHEVSVKTWQTKSQRPQILNTPGEVKYWQQVAALGAMRSYILEHDAKPVAFLLSVQWKGQFIAEEMGYDPAFEKSSPGNIMLYRILEDVLANDPPTTWDFGYGDNQYKRILCNHESTSGPISLFHRSLRPLAIVRLIESRRWASQRCRAVVDRLGLTTHARRLYRKSAKSV